MKKITLLFVLVFSICNAQEVVKTQNGKYVKLNPNNTWEFVETPKILTKDELKFNEKDLAYFTKNIELKNGKNEKSNVELSVTILKKYLDKINFDKMDDMIDITCVEGKYALKNKATFNPISLKINYISDDGLVMWIDFTGENDYGATKDSSKLVYFDENGKMIKSL